MLTLQQRLLAFAYYLFVLVPAARWGHTKPRLAPAVARLDLMLRSSSMCAAVTRFTRAELFELASDLLISVGAPTTGNWRFAPFHRLILFLIVFGNAWPSRKLRMTLGWAANSVLNNWRYHIDHIVECLDAPGSRQ